MKFKLGMPAMMALFVSVSAQAENDSDTTETLDTLVVVAYKQARPVEDVVGDVSVITADQLEDTISQDMANAIRYEANIHMEDGGTRFGQTGINIRGIGGNRVAIEIDGVPNAKTFNLGSYSFATAGFPEVDLIQSIEILKGPASTLYGSDALGGIVAIKTWDPDVLLAQHPDNHWTRLRFGFDGKRYGRFITLSSAWDLNQHGLMLSATQRDGKGVVNNHSILANDTADWDVQTVFGKWNFDTSAGNSWSLGFQALQKDQFTQINSFIGQGRFSRTTDLSGEDTSKDHKVTVRHDFNVSMAAADAGTAQVYLAQTDFQQDTFEHRFSRSGTPLLQFRQFNFDSSRLGLELNFTKSFYTNHSQHRLIYGLEYVSTDVKESRDARETNLNTQVNSTVVLGEQFPLRDFPITAVKELGVFIHDEISLGDSAWTLVPALRFDHHDLSPKRDVLFDNGAGDVAVVSLSASDFSPKLGLLYDFNDQVNAYAQFVRGFRAPPYDDVNIGFNLALFNYQAIPNPDLKSETSDGFELGLRFSGDNQQVQFHVFHNEYQNLIVSRDLVGSNPDTGGLIFQSRNVEDATIYGAELDFQWQMSNQWSVGWQLAWTRGKNNNTHQPLNNISPAKASGQLQWHSVNGSWDVGLFGIFSQAKSRVDETSNNLFKPPGYATFDLISGLKISTHSQLRVGVYNLTDKKYWLWQQVRNFEPSDPIIEAMTQASRHFKVSYVMQW